MNRILLKTTMIGLSLGFVAATAAFSHHAVAMFDAEKTATIKGTVKEFTWLNPHAVLWVNADPENGEMPKLWAVEMTSPGILTRNGWTKRSFKPGDKVSVDVRPLRDGQPGGLFRKATLVDSGQVLTYSMEPLSRPDSK